MDRILSIIKKESNLTCLPCERINLDYDHFAEYRDSNEHSAGESFEHPPITNGKKKIEEIPATIPTILKYFLDGSRRTYKVADVIIGGHYLPLIAGQVGVAVVKRREDGHGVLPMRDFCGFVNIVALPDRIPASDVSILEQKINRSGPVTFRLVGYTVKEGHDPVDLGIARIMSEMHDMEIDAVRRMASQFLLADNESLLVIDGPLRFKKKFDLVQFRNVIGLSKSFRPSFTVGKGKKKEDVGSITSNLGFGERSSVFKTLEEEKTIGMWYLRIRPPGKMSNPLQGIVKMECYAVDPEEQENGFDLDRIDTISRHILRERNVTPFKADSRWASHIYPIYLAETYLKTSFMSDTRFKAFF